MRKLIEKKAAGRNFGMFIVAAVGFVMFTCLIITPKAYSGSAPGVTDDQILIGTHTPLTGPIALYSKSAKLHKAILEDWGGKIHGRKLKVILLDDGCEPVKGVAAAKKLIYDDKVFMMHAGQCSNVGLAVRPIVQKTGTPYITQGMVHDGIVVPVVKNIFNPGFVSSSGSRTLVDFAMTIPGVKRVGVIRHTDEWAMALYEPLLEHLKEKYGMTPVVDVVTERGVPDVTPQVLRLKKANLDAVFSLIYVVATTTFLRDAHKLGLNIPILGSTATSVADQYESLKTLAPLQKYFSPYWCKYPLDHPKVKPYENLFKKYYPTDIFDAQTIYITGAALVIMDALEKCGRDLTQEKFVDILETNYTNWEPDRYIGASPLTFSRTDHIGMDVITMSTIATGKFEVVNTYQDYEKLMKK